MKKYFLPGLALLVSLLSCEGFDMHKQDPGIFFKTDAGLVYRFSDFDFYDSSTHIFYLKSVHPELENLEQGSFTFLDKGEEIYSGSLWPLYMSSIPMSPFIGITPMFYGNYTIRIEYAFPNNPDPRNGLKMIGILKAHDLLQFGLSLTIDTIIVKGHRFDITWTVTNADHTGLLVLDPGKTGPDLFHYFTNGLLLYDAGRNLEIISNAGNEAPIPGNSWNMNWLSELSPGSSMTFTLHYVFDAFQGTGDYIATFVFPGLSRQVYVDQLYQGDARIWLGDIKATKRIVIP